MVSARGMKIIHGTLDTFFPSSAGSSFFGVNCMELVLPLPRT